MMNCPAEDKTCRLCGYADQSNLNIFTDTMRDVSKKILSLYPIILYQSDPLPKNICLKCFGNTLSKHDEYLKIEKIQNKWINNVRKNQPNNPYIRILDLIEAANQSITKELKNLSPDIYCESFQLIKFNQDFPLKINVSTLQQASLKKFTTSIQSLKQSSNDNKNQTSLLPSKPFESLLQQRLEQQKHNSTSQNEQKTHLKKLQSMLASNGCTLMTVKDKKKSSKHLPNINYSKNQCQYCLKIFHNQKLLSIHQANKHLKINLYKIFEKKPLVKKLRVAIDIMVNNIKWYRCQNCWNIYGNHESISNHWRMKRCDFFCKLCGIEYPTNPKNLRQHLLEVHGLTFLEYKDVKKKLIRLKYIKNCINLSEYYNDDDCDIKIYNNDTPKKIPILKLTRKSNSSKDEFNIKSTLPIEELNLNNNDSNKKPILRVKDITELQDDSKYEGEENYSNLTNIKLNKLIFEHASKNVKRN